jgi:hypothetical protein
MGLAWAKISTQNYISMYGIDIVTIVFHLVCAKIDIQYFYLFNEYLFNFCYMQFMVYLPKITGM